MKKGYLVLQNGQVFEGKVFGAEAPRIGELIFTTGVVGYVETLTDPSYCGQIILQTFPLIGNYGVMEEDFEGECAVHGYVVREVCDQPSNFRCEYDLDTYLKKVGVMGLCGVDTRQITRIIRDHGTMNAMICTELPEDLSQIANFRVQKAVEEVTCKEESILEAEGKKKFDVTVIDYGAKRHIAKELAAKGCRVRIVPATYTAQQILEGNPDGIVLSNGPSDPREFAFGVEQVKALFGKVPMLGICMGHQMLALANGADCVKLPYGHHGGNQPIHDKKTGKAYITTQNHNFAVTCENLKNGMVRFVNTNDETCEGIDYPEYKALGAQFHPETCAGSRDTRFLYEEFFKMMED